MGRGGFWRSGGPLDAMFGGSVVILVVVALVALVVKWPVQCFAAAAGGVSVLAVAAVVARREGRAAARCGQLAGPRVPRPAGPPLVEQQQPDLAAAAAAMRAAGFPESVVASWLAEPGGGVGEQAPAAG